jgi:hypothetical protein
LILLSFFLSSSNFSSLLFTSRSSSHTTELIRVNEGNQDWKRNGEGCKPFLSNESKLVLRKKDESFALPSSPTISIFFSLWDTQRWDIKRLN